jgi:hypothetical protein
MRKPRLSYANVASTLALVLATSGTAVAVTTIDGSSITNRSIAGKKLIKDTVTGTEVKESTLGKVPNADKLDGLDSSGFVKGTNARLLTRSGRIAADDNTDVYTSVYTLPGFGPLAVQCTDSANRFGYKYHNTTATTQQYAYMLSSFGSGSTPSDVLTYGDFVQADGMIVDGITNSGGSRGFHLEITLIRDAGAHYAQITLTGVTDTNGAGGLCDYAATAIIH